MRTSGQPAGVDAGRSSMVPLLARGLGVGLQGGKRRGVASPEVVDGALPRLEEALVLNLIDDETLAALGLLAGDHAPLHPAAEADSHQERKVTRLPKLVPSARTSSLLPAARQPPLFVRAEAATCWGIKHVPAG